MNTEWLLREAQKRGLHLEQRGDKLLVTPARLAPPELLDVLREHKQELLDLLESKTAHLTPDCAPWLHVARQILSGEFDGADRSMRASLAIGLRSIDHPACRAALARIEGAKP